MIAVRREELEFRSSQVLENNLQRRKDEIEKDSYDAAFRTEKRKRSLDLERKEPSLSVLNFLRAQFCRNVRILSSFLHKCSIDQFCV